MSNSLTHTINTMGKRLLSYIQSKVNVREDAEDILQEVWFQFSRLTDIDRLENTSAWLYAVAKNKITDFYRKSRLEKFDIEDFEFKDLLLMDTSQNPDLNIFKDYVWDKFLEALNELPENQKLVFVQNELEDKTLQEIADETGENLKTIISRKGYALKNLRKKLEPIYNELNTI